MNISVVSTNRFKQAIAAMLVMLFFYTAASKLFDMDLFERQLSNQTLPDWSVGILLWLIPVSEIIVSLLLLAGPTRTTGLYGSALLMLIFTGYTGLVLLNVFNKVPCSCGGVISSMGFTSHFSFNLFFLGLSVVGIYISDNKTERRTSGND